MSASGDATPHAPATEAAIPRIQRLFESIPFLIFIGIVLPTLSYTVWSIYELSVLPRFDETAVAQGSPHLSMAEPAATGAAGSAGAATATAADAPPGGVPGAAQVSMRSLAFSPTVLEIESGTTVTWTNDDPFDHAVAHGTPDTPIDGKLFYSGDFPSGASFSHTFEHPGTFELYCSTVGHYAAGMTMTVIVKEAP